MAQRLSLRYFFRLWALSRGMYRSQWKWRRALGVLFFLRKAQQLFGKKPTLVSTTTMRPGTSLYIGTGDVPVKVSKQGSKTQVISEITAS